MSDRSHLAARVPRSLQAALAALVVVVVGCSPRPHVGVERDYKDAGAGTPAVVYVERPKPPARRSPVATPQVPLDEEKEPNDDVAHAQPFPFPKGIQGTLAARPDPKHGDEDVYQWLVNVDAPSLVRIELSGIAGRTLALDVLDGDGKRLTSASDAEPGAPEVVPDWAVSPGQTWYLRVRDAGKHAPSDGDAGQRYQLVASLAPLTPTDEVEPNDTPDRASAMTGADLTGYFGRRHDDDWVRPPAPGGGGAADPATAMRIELTGVEGVASSLRVFDAGTVKLVSGAKLPAAVATAGAAPERGQAVRMRNAPVPPGGPLLLVHAESGYSVDARWGLSVSPEPLGAGLEVEPNDAVATASELVVVESQGGALPGDGPGAIHGYLWRGDVDCYRVRSSSAGVLRLSVEPPPGASKVDLTLEVLDAATGRTIMKVDDAGPGGGELVPDLDLAAGATVGVRVLGRARDELFEAPYTLAGAVASAGPEGPDAVEHEPDDDAQRATPAEAGRAVRGWLSPRGDEDWYVVTPPPGTTTVRAALDRAPAGTTPSVKIFDANHATVAAGTTSASGAMRGAGPLWVVVRDTSHRAAARDPYSLTVSFQ